MLAEQTAEIERIVIPHSAYELENALHLDELPRVRYTWVRIAAKQMGVGGDDSWGAPVPRRSAHDAANNRRTAAMSFPQKQTQRTHRSQKPRWVRCVEQIFLQLWTSLQF